MSRSPDLPVLEGSAATMMTPCVRRPAVSDYYYPADPLVLRETVSAFATPKVLHRRDRALIPAHALILPHGSYQRAGAVLGATFARVSIPRRCVILGPSHTGSSIPWSLLGRGAYRTPLGDVPIDEVLAKTLQTRCRFLEADPWAQRGEHAIEVLLPFLQSLGPADLRIVPIIIGSDDGKAFSHLAHALAQIVLASEERILLIASSDLSHYEPQKRGAQQDRALIDIMRALDAQRLIRHIQDGEAVMCGYGATACVLEATKRLGATCATLVAYSSSAEAAGDPNSTTGYASLLIL